MAGREFLRLFIGGGETQLAEVRALAPELQGRSL
jgi:ATP-dependent protease HslVU (ClpYQ) ATPase subunit